MSVYYYYVNRTKKEYFSSGDIGYGLKDYAYRIWCLPLIGFLQINGLSISSPSGPCTGHKPEDNEDFPLEGHWANDDVQLVAEWDKEYEDICEFERYGTEFGNTKWTNISHQLLEEYNKFIVYWTNNDKKDIEKLSIPVGPNGLH